MSRTLWTGDDGVLRTIDQTALPFERRELALRTVDDCDRAIREMQVRGAPLIGAVGAYGLALALRVDASDGALRRAAERLAAARPTAVNLRWALDRVRERVAAAEPGLRAALAWDEAGRICDEDVACNASIGEQGARLLRALAEQRSVLAGVAGADALALNLLTHCNAGRIATVDHGTALAPIYLLHAEGVPVHVWVDETRPRNQGASLTAWELGQHGVPHTLIADNAGGHLMQHGLVDLVITGSDRVTRNGDVANKIGTYLKALAARDNQVPMYVALPSSTFDFALRDGVANIPIEERDAAEVRCMSGKTAGGTLESVQICPDDTPARNWGFDVTPARLVTKLICERGLCDASEAGILALFPEQR